MILIDKFWHVKT